MDTKISHILGETSEFKNAGRSRFHSTLEPSNPLKVHTSKRDQNLENRGHLRMLLIDNQFENAKIFSEISQI
jgi:hypothetical protein